MTGGDDAGDVPRGPQIGTEGMPAPEPAICSPYCEDFPADPLVDEQGPSPVPADAAQRFGAPDAFSGPGPCVLEPALSDAEQPGALLPRNWLQPRFRFEPFSGENLWEIRLRSEHQRHDLVVYTTRTTWSLPRDIWEGLADHAPDSEVLVTIRGVDVAGHGMPSGVRGSFGIAPVRAEGKLVYWATSSSEVRPDTSKLVGFAVGDEQIIDALTLPQVGDRGILEAGGRNLRSGQGVDAGHAQCIGCHVSTPDGEAVAFTDHWPWNNLLASVQADSAGELPSYVSPGVEALLNQPWLGMQTFSPAHWAPGRRIVVSAYSPRNLPQGVGYSDGAPYPSASDSLMWINLEATLDVSVDPGAGDIQAQRNAQVAAALGSLPEAAFGLLTLEGETRSIAAPDFSHDGMRIVYTSADYTQDGRLGANNREIDLHSVPFHDGRGGAVEPVAGASEPGVAEYYPAFSADDALLAFNRVAQIDMAPMYYRPDAEVFVVPAEGGEALRLLANDPPACGGERSPGVINSWPKWSPAVARVARSSVRGSAEFADLQPARSFYFLIFSSARAYPGQFEIPRTQYSPPDTRSSQLYMTTVVRNEETGELTSYPAVYLWNQDPTTSNLTPAWDDFKIPDIAGPQ